MNDFIFRVGDTSPVAMSVAGRVEFLMELLQGIPLRDSDGFLTGERSEPLITKEDFARVMGNE